MTTYEKDLIELKTTVMRLFAEMESNVTGSIPALGEMFSKYVEVYLEGVKQPSSLKDKTGYKNIACKIIYMITHKLVVSGMYHDLQTGKIEPHSKGDVRRLICISSVKRCCQNGLVPEYVKDKCLEDMSDKLLSLEKSIKEV